MIQTHDDTTARRLDTDDARAVREAGARFAADLLGTAWTGFMLALAERGDRLRRAVLDAGHTPEQARLAAAHFEEAARVEWAWIEAATGTGPGAGDDPANGVDSWRPTHRGMGASDAR